MTTNDLFFSIRRYWANSQINYCIRILIAFISVVVPSWYLGYQHATTPLLLGIIASAVAETDDTLSGRVVALFTSLICFAVASFSIEILFDYPWIFVAGLMLSTFCFTMLGAMGGRYASISFASLLIAVYTMLGANNDSEIWYQPSLLITGASCYGLLSLLWLWLWPHQPMQQSLSTLFASLADYLDNKATLFHPSLQPDNVLLKQLETQQSQATQYNAQVVNALNLCRNSLLQRVRRGRINDSYRQFLRMYFIAQDIHERTTSTHKLHPIVNNALFNSDFLFRISYLLREQAATCASASYQFALGKPCQPNPQLEQALDELTASLAYVEKQQYPRSIIEQLQYLTQNLTTIGTQLRNISDDLTHDDEEDTEHEIALPEELNIQDRMTRIIANMNLDSLLFRHAIRLSVALGIGYAIIQSFAITSGYWILLTILFVCQSNYSETRNKLIKRMIGTVFGILLGFPLLTWFPDNISQMVFILTFGVLFFAFRTTHYTTATTFITLLVLMSFEQQGNGYGIMLPRLLDTGIGCALSVAAVRFILPDWQAYRLRGIMQDSISANRDYLAQIIGQYRIGKRDNLAYRAARRNAHNQIALLTTAISNMLLEPGRYRTAVDESFRFLYLNHAMLSYISTLGAHRMLIADDSLYELINKAHREIHQQLDKLISMLNSQPHHIPPTTSTELEAQLEQWQQLDDGPAQMIIQQLCLIYQSLPEMDSLTEVLAYKAKQTPTSAEQ